MKINELSREVVKFINNILSLLHALIFVLQIERLSSTKNRHEIRDEESMRSTNTPPKKIIYEKLQKEKKFIINKK